jgi:hypothetical protein
MLSLRPHLARNVLWLIDLLFLVVGLELTCACLRGLLFFTAFGNEGYEFLSEDKSLLICILVGPLAFHLFGLYSSQRPPSEIGFLKMNLSLGAVLVVLFGYSIVIGISPTADLLVAFLLFLIVTRSLLRFRSKVLELSSVVAELFVGNCDSILICGSTKDRSAWIHGCFTERRMSSRRVVEFDSTLEGLDTFVHLLHRESVGMVIFCVRKKSLIDSLAAIHICEAEGIEMWMWMNISRGSNMPSNGNYLKNSHVDVLSAPVELGNVNGISRVVHKRTRSLSNLWGCNEVIGNYIT